MGDKMSGIVQKLVEWEQVLKSNLEKMYAIKVLNVTLEEGVPVVHANIYEDLRNYGFSMEVTPVRSELKALVYFRRQGLTIWDVWELKAREVEKWQAQ